jgi:hypothetical protein
MMLINIPLQPAQMLILSVLTGILAVPIWVVSFHQTSCSIDIYIPDELDTLPVDQEQIAMELAPRRSIVG